MTKRSRLLVISSMITAFGSLSAHSAQAAGRRGTVCGYDDEAAYFCLEVCMPETGECNWEMRANDNLCCQCDVI